MRRMLLAETAILLELKTVGMLALILFRRVITLLAFSASQGDLFARHSPNLQVLFRGAFS